VVENKLHWALDMTFREDEQRKRALNAYKNFAIVRKIALNLLKKDQGKGSLRTKRRLETRTSLLIYSKIKCVSPDRCTNCLDFLSMPTGNDRLLT
jgi:hypothetical protein